MRAVLSCFSSVRLCPWGFSRQEYWSGLPHPPPGDPPEQGLNPSVSVSPALAGRFFPTSAIGSPDPLLTKGKHQRTIYLPWKKATTHKPGREFSPETESVGTLTLDFLVCRTVGNKWLLFLSGYSIFS